MHLPKFLKDIVTDDTGVNFTPDKVAMVVGIAVYFGLGIDAVAINKEPFMPNAANFGLGLGAVLGAGGASMWLASRQKSTPPDGEEKP
jgi:hypothetical protein